MLISTTACTYLGIDPGGGRPPFAYAALDADLRLLALGKGRLADVLAFIAGQGCALVAINAPPQPVLAGPPQPVLTGMTPMSPAPGQRLAERQVRERGWPIYRAPAHLNEAPPWMRRGFALYQRLRDLGYQPYPQPEAARQWLEVPAEAAFTALLGQPLLPAHHLEGRWQRQILLADAGVGIQDPMRFFEEITRHRLRRGQLPLHLIYAPGELNALVAAFTAWLAAHRSDQVILLGDAKGGHVVLPQGGITATA
ncbi:MAG: DUF429 domain-containing protein [Thermanaerothrix sp.]|nr:DUF429 domain-containing protein [Thermanaerothrix sp.]